MLNIRVLTINLANVVFYFVHQLSIHSLFIACHKKRYSSLIGQNSKRRRLDVKPLTKMRQRNERGSTQIRKSSIMSGIGDSKAVEMGYVAEKIEELQRQGDVYTKKIEIEKRRHDDIVDKVMV